MGLKYVDVYRERPIRLTVRVLVPVNEHPKVCNFCDTVTVWARYTKMWMIGEPVPR